MPTGDDPFGSLDDEGWLAADYLSQLAVAHVVELPKRCPHSLVLDLDQLQPAVRLFTRHGSRVPRWQADPVAAR